MSRYRELARWAVLDRLRALTTKEPEQGNDVVEVTQIDDNVVLTLANGERLAYKVMPWGPDLVQAEKWELRESMKDTWDNFE